MLAAASQSRLACQLRAGLMVVLYRKSLLVVQYHYGADEDEQRDDKGSRNGQRGNGRMDSKGSSAAPRLAAPHAQPNGVAGAAAEEEEGGGGGGSAGCRDGGGKEPEARGAARAAGAGSSTSGGNGDGREGGSKEGGQAFAATGGESGDGRQVDGKGCAGGCGGAPAAAVAAPAPAAAAQRDTATAAATTSKEAATAAGADVNTLMSVDTCRAVEGDVGSKRSGGGGGGGGGGEHGGSSAGGENGNGNDTKRESTGSGGGSCDAPAAAGKGAAKESRAGAGADVNTLMSVDTGRAVNLLLSFHELWSLPWQMALALYLLYTQVGYAHATRARAFLECIITFVAGDKGGRQVDSVWYRQVDYVRYGACCGRTAERGVRLYGARACHHLTCEAAVVSWSHWALRSVQWSL